MVIRRLLALVILAEAFASAPERHLQAAMRKPERMAASALVRPYTSQSTTAARCFGGRLASVWRMASFSARRCAGSPLRALDVLDVFCDPVLFSAPRARAQMVDAEVARDAKEPGARLIVALERVEVLPGAQKSLLAEIVRGLFVAGQSPEVAKDVALIAPEERLERIHARLRGRA